jgi:hypothetical protein
VYERLFALLYGTGGAEAPVRLGDVIHWRAGLDGCGLNDLSLNRSTAYVPSGYFYRAHTSAPSEPEVAAALRTAATRGADWVLYPTVRDEDDTRALTASGFVALPWFVEAEYRVRHGLDADLRAQLGPGRHRELLRLVRRADERFFTTVTEGHDALTEAGVLESFDRVHRLNLLKYGHGANHFSADITHALADSPLGSRLCLFRRHLRQGGDVVQAVLALIEDGGEAVHLLVQGIDHGRVPPGQNLYATSLYEIFRWGVRRGITVFNLGRGAERVKLNLGANAFHLLANHLGSVSITGTGSARREAWEEDDEPARLRRASRRRLDIVCDGLREAVHRRGVVDLVRLPSSRNGKPS